MDTPDDVSGFQVWFYLSFLVSLLYSLLPYAWKMVAVSIQREKRREKVMGKRRIPAKTDMCFRRRTAFWKCYPVDWSLYPIAQTWVNYTNLSTRGAKVWIIFACCIIFLKNVRVKLERKKLEWIYSIGTLKYPSHIVL